jgi:predicted TIM-barrel fold metal-dependent hydrolase
MNRRKFLKSSSLVLAGTCANPLSEILPVELRLFPIVDTHLHLVDFARFGRDWAHPPVSGNFSMREYEKAIEGLNITKAVYVEVAVPKDRRHEESLYAIELCETKSNPVQGAIIKADIYSNDFEDYMSEFIEAPYIKGIRGSFTSQSEILDDQVVKNIRVLGKMKMNLEFSIPTGWLRYIPELVSLCPETVFIVEHCGNVDPRAFFASEALAGKADHDRDQWVADMTNIASEPNVACKISGVVTRSSGYPLTAVNLGPAINQCLDIFGPDRVMFASDWPWSLKNMELRNWVDILMRVVENRSHSDRKKLFYDNALKFYKI